MKTWLLKRFKERSTWTGIITLASIAGYTLHPDQRELVVTLGTSLVALLLTFTADLKPEVIVNAEPAEKPDQFQGISDAERSELKG